MDQMFRNPQGPILPVMQGLVAQAVIGTAEGRSRYFERIAMLLSGQFTAERLIQHAEEIHGRIRPVLLAMNPNLARQHDQQVARLCDAMAQRVSSLQQQIVNPPTAPIQAPRFQRTRSAMLPLR
jgi:spore coat protein H